MKKIFELVLVYLIGVLFIATLAFRVNAIDNETVSNASVAINYSSVSNYE